MATKTISSNPGRLSRYVVPATIMLSFVSFWRAAAIVPALFAIAVTVYFWWTNTVGVPFSSGKALRIMQITTVMVVLLIGWCILTVFQKGYQPVPVPTLANLKFGGNALGWLKGTVAPTITAIAILIGLGIRSLR